MFRYTCWIRLAAIPTDECEGVVTLVLRSDQGPQSIWNSQGINCGDEAPFACAHHVMGKKGGTAPFEGSTIQVK